MAKKKRSKNALSVGRMIENTKENIEQAELSMELAGPEELDNLHDKNNRRKTAIARMEEQIREKKAFDARRRSFEE